MKRLELLWALLVVFLLGLTGCMSDLPEETASTSEEGELLKIRVSMPQNNQDSQSQQESLDSRVHYDDESLDLTWETGDKLRLVGFDNNGNFKGTTDFTLDGLVGTSETVFVGPEVEGATYYDIYYLCAPDLPVDKNGKVQMRYDGQRQFANNSTDHLKKSLFIKSKERVPALYLKLETEDIPLRMQNSIMRFDFSNIPDNFIKSIQTVTDLEWKVGDRILSMTFDNLKVDTDLKSISAFMCFEGMNVNKGESIHVLLKGRSTHGLTKSEREYKIKVESNIVFEPNSRYFAEIEMSFDLISGRRIYYTSNIELKPEMFSPTVVAHGYDASTGKGYMEFDDFNVLNLPIEFNANALQNNLDITNLHFEDGVDYIGENAFEGCKNLQDVVLPSEMRVIGNRAFSGCEKLTTLKLPETINVIDGYAFDNCTALQSVVLPEGLQIIDETLFNNCTGLKMIQIPSTVTQITVDAFKTCSALANIHIKASSTPQVGNRYPNGFSDEQITNPLGFNLEKLESIYVPIGSKTAYETRRPESEFWKNRNPWYNYRGKYIEE